MGINENDAINYKVVAGFGRRKKGTITLKDFINWVRYEVYRDEDNWRKK